MSRVGQFGQISDINDHLCLSGAQVLKADKIRQKKITCIINATIEEPNVYLSGVDYLKIRVDDHPSAHLDTYFDLAADKIKATKERGGRTLVHCMAGVSRSATLCMVYLVKHQRMNLRQAYAFVKSKRSIIRPNVGFWKQMIDYELRLTAKNTVHLVPTRQGNVVPDVYVEELRRHFIPLSLSSNHSDGANGNRGPSYTNGLRSSSSSPSGVGFRRSSAGTGYRSSALVSGSRRSPSPAVSSAWSPRYPSSTVPSGTNLSALSLVAPTTRTKLKSNLFSSLYSNSEDFLFPHF